MKISLVKKLKEYGLPEATINILLVLLLIFSSSYFLAGVDFGIFKVPKLPFSPYLSVIGIVLLVILFIPIFPASEVEEKEEADKVLLELVQELKAIRYEFQEYDKSELLDSLIRNRKQEGLKQNPYLIFIQPLGEKYLNNHEINKLLTEDLRNNLEELIYSRNNTIEDTLFKINDALRLICNK